MISLSSSVVVLKMLSAAGLTSTLASRVMIGLLIVQDLAVVPMLIILPQLGDFENFWGRLARSLGIAAVFLAAVVMLGTRLLPRVLNRRSQVGLARTLPGLRRGHRARGRATRRNRRDFPSRWALSSPAWC